ncbi:MAG: 3-deoxy-manno-octulosonate cytidylyltransferase [Armatimonadota bacterium]
MRAKILERPELARILAERRARGERIVFTNGCFDILHVGHLRYLEEAKALGDVLVVGVNSDESVRTLKGASRPFVREEERAEMLAGFGCIDYITIFGESTASETIRALAPHVYAKGGDVAADQVPEKEALDECGGEIAILCKVEGKSTTELVSQVRNVPAKAGGGGRVIGMIPARLAATRLPNKPLLEIAGKPMIQWVYERASAASLLDEVIVVTPDPEIVACVEGFGGRAEITSHEHRSGTDRLAEAARRMQADVVVNIQGDEPLLDPTAIDLLAETMLAHPEVPMASLMCPLSEAERDDPAAVKVVTDRDGFALYFSRFGIPYPRGEGASPKKHIGLYAYRYHFLLAFAALAPTPLETAESLEQLRALEHGHRIKMVETDFSPTSVDTLEDLERVRALLGGSR